MAWTVMVRTIIDPDYANPVYHCRYERFAERGEALLYAAQLDDCAMVYEGEPPSAPKFVPPSPVPGPSRFVMFEQKREARDQALAKSKADRFYRVKKTAQPMTLEDI